MLETLEACENVPAFQSFCSEMMLKIRKDLGIKQSLGDFLITPIQRVPR